MRTAQGLGMGYMCRVSMATEAVFRASSTAAYAYFSMIVHNMYTQTPPMPAVVLSAPYSNDNVP